MGDRYTPKTKKRKSFRVIVVLALLAVIIIAVISLSLGSSWFVNLFSQRPSEITVQEFSFDVGHSRVFAEMDGSIVAAGTLGISVVDFAGRETLSDSFRMVQPALRSTRSRSIAFDIGGSAVRVFSDTQLISSIETYGTVVSASINQNGWFSIVTQEGQGVRGIVAVHNAAGHEVYRVSLGTGFALSALLSHDNNSLAILNFSETGSRINFYHGIDEDKNEPDFVFDRYGGLIIEITYLSNNDMLVISTDSLFIIDSDGYARLIYSFTERHLGGFTHNDNFITLHLYDYGIGHHGRLVTLRRDGTILEELAIDREILSMSSANDYLAILLSEGVVFYNSELEFFVTSSDSFSSAGASRVLALSNGVALATNDSSAIVVQREEH